ncbi:MAG: putative protein serine/threonine/tyrosine phosphatase [Akkermansiaceae bacterium]|nr:putative protein serine/threonine/tyrosine phosphatase [Akkermansiaceae bacterium]
MNRLPFLSGLVVTAALVSCSQPAVRSDPRPAQWAVPLKVAGVPNLHRVSKNVYRSAQPTAEGMRNLEAMGVRTVINLRYFHSDDPETAGTHLRAVRAPNLTWSPDKKRIDGLMAEMTDPRHGPVLIHCQHGADRTGSICAIYRVRVQGWTVDEALREMTGGGYNYHPIWSNLPTWVRENAPSTGSLATKPLGNVNAGKNPAALP